MSIYHSNSGRCCACDADSRAQRGSGSDTPGLISSSHQPPAQRSNDSNIRKAMLAIVKKADLRCRRSIIHVTRHTFGSRLIQQGESLAYVKEQMGHASIQSPIKQSKHSSDSKC